MWRGSRDSSIRIRPGPKNKTNIVGCYLNTQAFCDGCIVWIQLYKNGFSKGVLASTTSHFPASLYFGQDTKPSHQDYATATSTCPKRVHMSNHNAEIPLEPNSLYIATTMLTTPGFFHWALIITDAYGSAMRYWRERRPRARDFSDTAELFEYGPIVPTTYTRGMNTVLAYIKVHGYRAAAYYDFVNKFNSVFRHSFTSVRANRTSGSSCRTWAMGALYVLEADGLLVRPPTHPVLAIERTVTQISAWIEVMVVHGTFKSRVRDI